MAADTVIRGVLATNDSDKALCVKLPDGSEKWIPKSVITSDSEVYDCSLDGRGPGDLVVKTWFAKKEHLD